MGALRRPLSVDEAPEDKQQETPLRVVEKWESTKHPWHLFPEHDHADQHELSKDCRCGPVLEEIDDEGCAVWRHQPMR